jgi:hypothetical protein
MAKGWENFSQPNFFPVFVRVGNEKSCFSQFLANFRLLIESRPEAGNKESKK